jgi:murein DD-endopeptidase MepM/ murein hydrolase activator NlpD
MLNRKYFLDVNDLQYKQLKLPWKRRLLYFFFWFSGSVVLTIFYVSVFDNFFGSPKEKILLREIGNIKLQYELANRELDDVYKSITDLKISDEKRYRSILGLESIPGSIRNPGFGGVDRFRTLNGYFNSNLMRSIFTRVEDVKNMTNVQSESFEEIIGRARDWKYEMDHLPAISPVDPRYPPGEGFHFREKHPVLGVGRMHYGLDFTVPYGTRVYSTGDGRVHEARWNSGGFGNVVVIDHGNGLYSYYAHLSEIKVPAGIAVKRGDLIGLSGSSGLSSGAHLHYQINKLGQPVNPINFFNNDVTGEEFNEMIEAFASRSIYR